MTSMQVDGTPSPSQTAEEPRSRLNALRVLDQIKNQQLEANWASWVESEFAKIKNARQPFERQWHINLAFYSGRQYVSPVNVPGQGFRLVAPKAPPWRVRMVINKVRTAVRTEASKLTSSKPIPTVIPATTEDQDWAAAMVAEQIVKSEFTKTEFQRMIKSWVWWGVITGNSYIKSYYDANDVDEAVQLPAQPTQIPGLMNPSQPIKGKICMERINPFHIYVPDLLEEELEKQPYIMHVTTKTPLWVEQHFGFKPQADSRAANTTMESAILSPVGATNQGYDSVLVKEVWLKPNAHPDFPQGGLLTIIANRVVQKQTTWPLPFKEYPFYKYEGIPTGGFYTESVVTDLIPIQKEYNRTKSQMIEIKNLMGKPKLLAPRGSIDPRKVSSEPGQAILYTMGYEKPTVLQAAEVPASMYNELELLSADFDDISGQHEITRGNTPSQVTSGTAISFLQEQDDSKLAYQVSGIEHCVSKLGTHYLKYASTYWKEERLIRIVGRDSDFEARMWKGSDLRGNTDVMVQSGSALPVSKAAKQALVNEWMLNGWLAPETGMEILELGGFEKAREDFLADKRAAQRENMKMAEVNPQEIAPLVNPPVGPDGQPVLGGPDGETPMDPMTGMPWQPQPPLPVNSWDNHQAHIHFHNQFRKSQQFELLDDAIKTAFELHVQAHQMAMILPQQGMAGIVEGQPPVGPEGDPNASVEGGEAQNTGVPTQTGSVEQPLPQ